MYWRVIPQWKWSWIILQRKGNTKVEMTGGLLRIYKIGCLLKRWHFRTGQKYRVFSISDSDLIAPLIFFVIKLKW